MNISSLINTSVQEIRELAEKTGTSSTEENGKFESILQYSLDGLNKTIQKADEKLSSMGIENYPLEIQSELTKVETAINHAATTVEQLLEIHKKIIQSM